MKVGDIFDYHGHPSVIEQKGPRYVRFRFIEVVESYTYKYDIIYRRYESIDMIEWYSYYEKNFVKRTFYKIADIITDSDFPEKVLTIMAIVAITVAFLGLILSIANGVPP